MRSRFNRRLVFCLEASKPWGDREKGGASRIQGTLPHRDLDSRRRQLCGTCTIRWFECICNNPFTAILISCFESYLDFPLLNPVLFSSGFIWCLLSQETQMGKENGNPSAERRSSRTNLQNLYLHSHRLPILIHTVLPLLIQGGCAYHWSTWKRPAKWCLATLVVFTTLFGIPGPVGP